MFESWRKLPDGAHPRLLEHHLKGRASSADFTECVCRFRGLEVDRSRESTRKLQAWCMGLAFNV